MAAHSPTAMPRMKLTYNTTAGTHRMVCNLSPGQTAGDAAASATALTTVLKTLLRTDQSFSLAEYAPAASTIFNPITWAAVAGTNANAAAAQDRAACLTFVGRTITGARARLFMFTDLVPVDANYRITTAELADVLAIVNFLNGNQTSVYARDGNPAKWKAYANLTYHKHWVRRLRG